VLRHRASLPGYARLSWPARKRLDLAVLLLGLRHRGTWRGVLLVAAGLALAHGLRGYWSLHGPGWQLGQCLVVLAALPAMARARRRMLRQLLSRGGGRAGSSPHGVL